MEFLRASSHQGVGDDTEASVPCNLTSKKIGKKTISKVRCLQTGLFIRSESAILLDKASML